MQWHRIRLANPGCYIRTQRWPEGESMSNICDSLGGTRREADNLARSCILHPIQSSTYKRAGNSKLHERSTVYPDPNYKWQWVARTSEWREGRDVGMAEETCHKTATVLKIWSNHNDDLFYYEKLLWGQLAQALIRRSMGTSWGSQAWNRRHTSPLTICWLPYQRSASDNFWRASIVTDGACRDGVNQTVGIAARYLGDSSIICTSSETTLEGIMILVSWNQ